ncbi:GNAT family N-acetyltransferase [Paenibacillus segetis]|uniref:Acetyltransferase n=1 Tax=Paenibacillus segetis TaxID=1325360 RepID=A0ABQ1YEV2_9BACL|nr:GNAT family N-acetyltransferase [Paenibacillus segetis]GGH23167.1 acetyltransferase [Paenibacillus segetis]
MVIRKFLENDITQIVTLFYDTVHSVNQRDYSPEQLDAWAPKDLQTLKLQTWKDSMSYNVTYVAEIDGAIVGFTDMTPEGYLDRLYVHKDYQRQGIASALLHALESKAVQLDLKELLTDASITAKPFFESHGYRVIQSQLVERRGITLGNYRMIKPL